MRRAGTTIAITVALGTMALAACSGSPPTLASTRASTGQPSTPTTSIPAPSAASTTGSAEATSTANLSASYGAAALKTYVSFRRAFTAAQRTADVENKSLDRFAADKALSQARESLLRQRASGVVYRGEPLISPQLTRVDLSTGTPLVNLSDCVDSRHWKPVYEATGKSAAAPGQPLRVPLAVAVRSIKGEWRVVEVQADRSRSC